MYRQGDVLVVPIQEPELPTDLIPAPRDRSGRLVLAYGEATGHAHVVSGDGLRLMCRPDDPQALFLIVAANGRVTHEEHGAIGLPAGYYRVVRQREYLPGSIRPVLD
jgi:hypothetical protein